MTKIDKHIVIARAGVPRYSSLGRKSAEMIQDALLQRYTRVDIVMVHDELDLQSIALSEPDLVFLGFKRICSSSLLAAGAPDTDVWASGFFERAGINHSGSPQAAIALDLNKDLAKQRVRAAGLPTAQYFMAQPGTYTSADTLPLSFPLFIKPPTQGGGRGIAADSVVHSFDAFEQKVEQIYERFHTPALAETYLKGREFSVAFLGSGDDITAMPIELVANPNQQGDRILDASVKEADSEQVIAVPAGLVREKLIRLATHIYQEIGGRDFGRIDIRMDATGEPHFLEANLVPGLSHTHFISYFTQAWLLNQGQNHEAMILKIVEICLERTQPRSEYKQQFSPSPLIIPAL